MAFVFHCILWWMIYLLVQFNIISITILQFVYSCFDVIIVYLVQIIVQVEVYQFCCLFVGYFCTIIFWMFELFACFVLVSMLMGYILWLEFFLCVTIRNNVVPLSCFVFEFSQCCICHFWVVSIFLGYVFYCV